jgi:ABC-type lipopolysaccharide export system ATPase subunit
VFDVADPLNPQFLTADEDFDAVDIISIDDLMILVSETGLNQYRFKNGKLNFLSSL